MLEPRDLIHHSDPPVDAVKAVIQMMVKEGVFDSPKVRQTVLNILAEVDEPALRVAVVGKTKAGKSTLINSLVGARVAPTDALSCTKFVAWFRDDDKHNWAQVRLLQDSRAVTVAWPPRLGQPIADGIDDESIDDIHVWRTGNPRLQIWTVIDTPGHNDTEPVVRERTLQVFRRHSVDVVVFVLNGAVAEEELNFFTKVRADLAAVLAGDGLESPSLLGDFGVVNTVAVLSRIDLANVGDPFEGAQKVIKEHADELRRLATTVIPVLGLLAENAGQITDDDYTALSTLAGLREHELTAWGLPDAATRLGVSETTRKRLEELLGSYGMAFAIRQIRNGNANSDADLRAQLLAHSGLGDLEETMRERFAPRVDALKARTAVRRLEKLSDTRRDLEALRPYLERIRGLDRMHTLREMTTYEQWKSGEVTLPPAIGQALTTLATRQDTVSRAGLADPAAAEQIKAALKERIGECDDFLGESWPEPANNIVRIMRKSYSLMLNDLVESESA